MDKINEIISTVAEEMDIDAIDLMQSKNYDASYARKMVYFIVHDKYRGAMADLSRASGKSTSTCSRGVVAATDLYSVDKKFKKHVDNVQRKLNPPKEIKSEPIIDKKEPIKMNPSIMSKSPFGMVYTDLDEIKIKRAKAESLEYMRHYGSGIQPLREGFALSRKKAGKV